MNTQHIVTYLPWILSALTILMMWLAGSRKQSAWAIGLANQALWLVYILCAGAWGLIPMNLGMWIVLARNWNRWRPDLAPRPFCHNCASFRRTNELVGECRHRPPDTSGTWPEVEHHGWCRCFEPGTRD